MAAKKVTQQQAIIAYLKSNKEMVSRRPSKRFCIFYDTVTGENVYVGRNGALRHGKTIADSISYREDTRQSVIEKGKTILKIQSMQPKA